MMGILYAISMGVALMGSAGIADEFDRMFGRWAGVLAFLICLGSTGFVIMKAMPAWFLSD
jgi:uncharacterized membrane protein YccC